MTSLPPNQTDVYLDEDPVNPISAWGAVLEALEGSLTQADLALFAPLRPLSLDGGELRVECPRGDVLLRSGGDYEYAPARHGQKSHWYTERLRFWFERWYSAELTAARRAIGLKRLVLVDARPVRGGRPDPPRLPASDDAWTAYHRDLAAWRGEQDTPPPVSASPETDDEEQPW
jgi:hypothetical protein